MSISVKYTTNTIRKNVFIEFVIVLLCWCWGLGGLVSCVLIHERVMIYNNKYIFFYLFFFWVLDLVDLDFVDLDFDLVLKIVP